MANINDLGYLKELFEQRSKILDFLEMINQGRIEYYKELALKLRVLYIDKSRRKSLLRVISDRFAIDLYVWTRRALHDSVKNNQNTQEILKNVLFIQTNSVATWFIKGAEFISPFDALEREDLFLRGKYYSYRSVIEVVADKQAAHIDEDFPDDHFLMQKDNIVLLDLPISLRAIYDTAIATIELINKIEKFLCSGVENPHIRVRE